ncbi:hypothetical protein TrLO_g12140 [Triparma laevis f. longispina]|uniref:START domain-containing protein n=1 Tax=Triparma laevis f. longispina TaxID=1714387 RepID=A0A9W7FRM8_9STRA|nr:hypothetical protein TrLO_g12140 [Triparma laevis f. longispina]
MEVTDVRIAKVEEDDVNNDEVHTDAKNNVPTVEHSIDTDVDAGVERAQEYQRTFDSVYAWAQKIRDTTTNSTPPSPTFEAIETPSNALFRLAWTPDSSPILHIEVSINTKFHDLVLGCSDPNRFTEYNRVFFPIKDLTTIDEDTKIVHGRTKSFFPGLSKQRDFVTAVQRRKTPTSLVLLHSAAPPEILPPTDQYVRAEAVQGAIVLEKEGETKCKVTIITHLDLKFSEWMTRKLCPRLAPLFIRFCKNLETVGNSVPQSARRSSSVDGFCAIGYAVTFPTHHDDDANSNNSNVSLTDEASSYLVLSPRTNCSYTPKTRRRKRSLPSHAIGGTMRLASKLKKKLSYSSHDLNENQNEM